MNHTNKCITTINGKDHEFRYALYVNGYVAKICDTFEEIEIEWLEAVYEMYRDMIHQNAIDESYSNRSPEKIISDERNILIKARQSVKICKLFIPID